MNSVAGAAAYGGITTYANNPQYRAWGGLKHLEYGNAVKADLTYDSGLRPATYNLQKTGSAAIMQKGYEYYKDGSLKFVDDALDGVFDRGQTYDHQGRVVTGKSSSEASGTTVTSNLDTTLPYRQSYAYNAFDNLTQRNNLHWGTDEWASVSNDLSYAYTNNRITGWSYDADGRATISYENAGTTFQHYDARGLMYEIAEPGGSSSGSAVNRVYSGDGREGKRIRMVFNENAVQWNVTETIYYIRSSVLGGSVISETTPTGGKKKTNVYAAGSKLAVQSEYTYNSTTTESVTVEHFDASGMSYRSSMSNGVPVVGAGDYDGAPGEFDPLGGNAGVETPYVEEPVEPPPPGPLMPHYPIFDDSTTIVDGQRVQCTLDGMAIGCATAQNMLGHSAIPADLAPYQRDPGFRFEDRGLGLYTWHVPGYSFSTPSGVGGSGTDDDPFIVGSTGEHPARYGSISIGWNFGWGTAIPTEPLTVEPPNTTTPTPSRPNFDLQKYKQCLWDLFKTEKGPDDRLPGNTFVGFYGAAKTPFSINLDYSKSKSQVSTDAGEPALGYSPDDLSRTVFIANDLNSIDKFVTTIHEIGNKIYSIFKTVGLSKPEASPKLRRTLRRYGIDDDDAGMALEECVFGGRVRSNGTILK